MAGASLAFETKEQVVEASNLQAAGQIAQLQAIATAEVAAAFTKDDHRGAEPPRQSITRAGPPSPHECPPLPSTPHSKPPHRERPLCNWRLCPPMQSLSHWFLSITRLSHWFLSITRRL